MISTLEERKCDFDRADQLSRVIDQIISADSTEELFKNLQGAVLSLFNGDRITVYILDRDDKIIKSVCKTGSIPSQIRLSLDRNSVAGFVATTGRVISIINAYNSVELMSISPDLKFDGSWDRLSGYNTRQILATPIINNGKTVGVIQVINKSDGDRFVSSDRQTINEIGYALGPTLERLEQKRDKK